MISFKETVYDKLVATVSSIDTSGFVLSMTQTKQS